MPVFLSKATSHTSFVLKRETIHHVYAQFT
jgi:hypothetical protein